MPRNKSLLFFCFSALVLSGIYTSCSPQRAIATAANKTLVNASGLKNAHIGISIYNAGTKKFLFNRNGQRYFVPASNTKIPTCYVAMKYLGDSICGINITETADKLLLSATGDPTLLDPEFAKQPVFDFLKNARKELVALPDNFKTSAWGSGWSWDDYDADYLAERSSLPIYSNVLWFQSNNKNNEIYFPKNKELTVLASPAKNQPGTVTREFRTNNFTWHQSERGAKEIRVPFITSQKLAWSLLSDTLKKPILILSAEEVAEAVKNSGRTYPIYSQPTDSVLRILMHRSDNFFAEQLLLMASNRLLVQMTTAGIIDTILQTDFRSLPQKPRWADGSGLSRYNLFTPQDFIFILNKINEEFGWERIKTIFPTGGTGTLASYYKEDAGAIFAKTGSLSGVVALSGFLITRKNKLFLFSILVNNHNTSATEVRKAIERFITHVRKKY